MARGQKIATAFLELGVDDRRLDQDMQKTKKQVNKGFGDLAQAAASGFAAFGLGRFLNFGIEANKQFEKAKIGFEVLTGSVEQGNKSFEALRTFSETTPFSFDQVSVAGKALLASGVAADQLTSKLQFLGDAAAAVDGNVVELTRIFTKIRNQGKLTGETFEQLTNQNINLMPVLQKQLGKTADEILKMRAAGTITAVEVEAAFREMNGAGGMFEGGMLKLSESVAGKLSTLGDKFKGFAADLTEVLMPVLKGLIDVAINLLDAFSALSPQMKKIVGIMVTLAPAIMGVVTAFKLMKLAGIGAAVGIRAALAATGIGIILPLIGFVISKFLQLGDTVEFNVKPILEKLQEPIKKLKRAWEVAWEAINTIVRTVVDTVKKLFGSLFEAIGVNINDIKEGFIGFVEFGIALIAEFVLNVAEWFHVIVHNWDLTMQLMSDAWSFMWSALGDIIRNFIPAAWELIKGFAMSIVEVFKSIPAAIKEIFTGGGLAGAIDELFADASAKMAASSAKAFSRLLEPSAETRRLALQMSGTLAKMRNEKKKLEAEREKAEEVIEDAETPPPPDEVDDEEKKVKKEIEIKFGRTGLQDFTGEVQDMFLKNEADDKQAKIVDLNQAQVDIQDEALGVNKEIRDELKGAAVIKVAGQ